MKERDNNMVQGHVSPFTDGVAWLALESATSYEECESDTHAANRNDKVSPRTGNSSAGTSHGY